MEFQNFPSSPRRRRADPSNEENSQGRLPQSLTHCRYRAELWSRHGLPRRRDASRRPASSPQRTHRLSAAARAQEEGTNTAGNTGSSATGRSAFSRSQPARISRLVAPVASSAESTRSSSNPIAVSDSTCAGGCGCHGCRGIITSRSCTRLAHTILTTPFCHPSRASFLTNSFLTSADSPAMEDVCPTWFP